MRGVYFVCTNLRRKHNDDKVDDEGASDDEGGGHSLQAALATMGESHEGTQYKGN
jgi:hypothetical protein